MGHGMYFGMESDVRQMTNCECDVGWPLMSVGWRTMGIMSWMCNV